MRGYKIINFNNFSKTCCFIAVNEAGVKKCDEADNYAYKADCCASFCSRWRKIKYKDIKIVRVQKKVLNESLKIVDMESHKMLTNIKRKCKHEPGCVNYMGTDYLCKKCGENCGQSEYF